MVDGYSSIVWRYRVIVVWALGARGLLPSSWLETPSRMVTIRLNEIAKMVTGLKTRVPAINEETKKAPAPKRDVVIVASMSLPQGAENFVPFAVSLHREFDTALRLLREEQACRVGAMTIERAVIASSPAKEEGSDSE